MKVGIKTLKNFNLKQEIMNFRILQVLSVNSDVELIIDRNNVLLIK